MENSKISDLLGIKPVASSVEKVTCGVMDGLNAVLSRICLPAAEELGLLLQDKVRSWRSTNAAHILQLAEEKLKAEKRNSPDFKAHPRVVFEAIDKGSWYDDVVVQDFWAGLLASSVSENEEDDSNCVFISLLSQLSSGEVRLLRYAALKSRVFVTSAGFPYSEKLSIELAELKELFQTNNVTRIDVALDHLRSLELFSPGGISGGSGFPSYSSEYAEVSLTSLALNLFLAGEGTRKSPTEVWSMNVSKKKTNGSGEISE